MAQTCGTVVALARIGIQRDERLMSVWYNPALFSNNVKDR